MNLQKRAKEVVVDNNGIAKSADFVAAGIRAVDVVNLCNAGFLTRVRHGYYQLAEQCVSSEEQLLATLIPKGIVCVESALFHYGYSDFAPRKWSIAVPRSMSRTKLKVDSLAKTGYFSCCCKATVEPNFFKATYLGFIDFWNVLNSGAVFQKSFSFSF